MKLFSSTFANLERGLDYASLNQKVISQNIANVDTPNYRAKEVEFKTVLNDSINQLEAKRTNARHFSFQSSNQHPAVKTKSAYQYNHNGNGVDLDREMSEMASNQIYFNALSDRINGKFNSLKSVVTGGK